MYQVQSPAQPEVIYPDSDGKPMSDNTKQFRWIVVIQQNLEWLFAKEPNVFVAGDLLWYPVEGNNKIRNAPDVMVAFGRPKEDRGSYQQWKEENIAPQVVFEILSPGNTLTEMNKKQVFYDRYGVEEYYLYDPDKNDLSGWLRSGGSETVAPWAHRLDVIDSIDNWTSPRLGIRFDVSGEELQIYRPDGERFATYVEISQRLEQERQRAEQAEQRAEQAEQRAARLAERLRAAGIDPEAF
ncbi:Uma2 family endonuclease [Coleofasciculus sp. H7-2]|uniref:Uma2 family endonuclease n=1 Tax=Coleofasciculus sp. H7-2 TaxID=3351545 RepID=UPI0036733CA2